MFSSYFKVLLSKQVQLCRLVLDLCSHLKHIQRTERSPEVANKCLMSIFGHASSSPQNAKNVNWLIMKYVSSLLW